MAKQELKAEAPKTEPKARTKEDQEREMQANVRIIRGTHK